MKANEPSTLQKHILSGKYVISGSATHGVATLKPALDKMLLADVFLVLLSFSVLISGTWSPLAITISVIFISFLGFGVVAKVQGRKNHIIIDNNVKEVFFLRPKGMFSFGENNGLLSLNNIVRIHITDGQDRDVSILKLIKDDRTEHVIAVTQDGALLYKAAGVLKEMLDVTVEVNQIS